MSGNLVFKLQKDNKDTVMVDSKDDIIATSERDMTEKTGYISVKENGDYITLYAKGKEDSIKGKMMTVATITRLRRQRENTFYIYIHTVCSTLTMLILPTSYHSQEFSCPKPRKHISRDSSQICMWKVGMASMIL